MLLFLLFLLGRADDCQLRLILNDLGGDGWGDNSVSGTANGGPVKFEPLSDSASVSSDGKASLESGAIGSFSFTIPSGSSLDITFQGTADDHCQQESWVVELFDIYNPFGAVILSQSAFVLKDGVVVPSAATVASVVCGPKPDAVSKIAVTSHGAVSTISWLRAPTDTTRDIAFTLFYTTDKDSDIHFLGVTFDNEFEAVLPIGKLHLSVQSLSEYGPGPVVSQDITIAPYGFGRLFLRLFSSRGNGWGGGSSNDGYVNCTLSGKPFYIATFGCKTDHGCYSKDHILDVPAGQDWDLGFEFNEPSSGTDDCSFKVYRQDAVLLFDSDQDINGPIHRKTSLTLNFDDGCPCADPWGDCVPANGVCGDGKQSRNTYKSVGADRCAVVVDSKQCSVPCPTDCEGGFGDYSECSPACGVGYKTRIYKISQQAENNGKDCPYADGYKDTVQCTENPSCPQQCSYRITGYDTEGDGWHGGNVVGTVGDINAVTLTLEPSSSDALDASKGSADFLAPRGSTVTFTWTPGTDANANNEASFDVKLIVAGDVCKGLPDVLENPAGLNTASAPTTVTSFVSKCVDCSKTPKDVCDKLHRLQCETSQINDNTCGRCEDGYAVTGSTDTNSACQDVDECSVGIDPCLAQNAKCHNTPGSYYCYCTDPTKPCDLAETCEATAQPSFLFLETGVIAKEKSVPSTLSATSCAKILTRKDWAGMNATEQKAWKDGVRALFTYYVMESITPGTIIPYNWITNDTRYGPYPGTANTKTPVNQNMSFWQWARTEHMFSSVVPGQQVHSGNPWFLPWHRNMLKNVEAALQKATSSCITIPFWDSSQNRVAGGVDAGTAALLSDTTDIGLCRMSGSSTANYTLNGDTSCPLKGIPGCGSWETGNPFCPSSAKDVWRQLSWGNLVDTGESAGSPGVRSPTEIYQLLNQYANDYGTFCSSLEGAHAGVHVAVGGWMGGLSTASGDPLFFMHHAFVDMIWAGQQSCAGVADITKLPNAKVWPVKPSTGQEFTTQMPRANLFSPKDMYDPTAIGTKYDYAFFSKLHEDSDAASYCYGDTGGNSDWWTGMTNSTAGAPVAPPTTTANYYYVTINGVQVSIYDNAQGTIWVDKGSYWAVYQPGWTYGRYVLNPNTAPTSTAAKFLEVAQHPSKSKRPRFAYSLGKPNADGSQPISGAPPTPYKKYKGFYTPGADGSQYCSHGTSKHKKAGKGKGKKNAKKDDKPKAGKDKEANNLKKLQKAYKEDYDANHDHASALEAAFRLECTFEKHQKKSLYTDAQIKGMNLQKVCAQGGCDDKCFQLLKGKNAGKHTKKYLKKHKGKYPKGYVDAVKECEGTTPPVLLEELALFEKNQYANIRPKKHHEGFVLDPASSPMRK